MTTTLHSNADWKAIRADIAATGETLGFVPTMGSLHAGHAALIERSLADNDRTVVSIFINPTQFNDPDDLRAYPRDTDADVAMLERLGVDYAFLPDVDTIYPDDYRFRLSESQLSTRLCGAHRPGHFDGVLTVVMRLFHIIRPQRAYFGEKDYQQYRLVADMVAAFFLDIDVRPCPIVRDDDGVALSSRNALLSPSARELAARFAATLKEGGSAAGVRARLEQLGAEQDVAITVDYVEDWDGRRLAAVVIDGVRLIDNVPL